jgi:hypothetical protein
MKDFSVSLDLMSKELKLADLTSRLGREPSKSSHALRFAAYRADGRSSACPPGSLISVGSVA